MLNKPNSLLQAFKDLLRQEKIRLAERKFVTGIAKTRISFDQSIESLPNAHQSRGGTHA